MLTGDSKISVNGAILTKRIVSVKMDEDTENIRSYIPRSQKIVAWIEQHADEIDNRKNGNIAFSFTTGDLKVRVDEIYNL